MSDLFTADSIVFASELPIHDGLEKALSGLELKDDLTHFLVSVKKKKPAVVATSIDQLVDETLKLSDEITQHRTAKSSEEDAYSTEFLMSNAKILLEAGEYELAKNVYKNLIQKGFDIVPGLLGLARISELQKSFFDAERHYKEALAYSSSIDIYKSLISILIRVGKDEEAAKYLIYALGVPELKENERFEFHKSLGNCYSRVGVLDKAAYHYSKAYEIDPQSDVLQVNVGSLALQKGDLKSAEEHFQKALSLNKKNEKAITGLGMVHLANKQTQKAHDCFLESLRLDINNIGAIYNLVKTAYELRYFEPTCRILEGYMKLNTESRNNSNLLYCYTGILFHQGHYNTALSEAEKILELNPQHSGAKEIKALVIEKLKGNNRY